MKTIIIVGGTREAARKRLEKIAPDNGVVNRDWYDEVEMDGHRIMAIGGEAEDRCFLIAAGCNNIAEIIVVDPDGVSEEMWNEINFVSSVIEM